MGGEFRALTADEQLGLWTERVTDDRGVVGTGWSELDSLLHRSGVAPATLALIGGRTGTRKTTVCLNLAANLLRDGRRVGLVGLDEPPATYVGKMASVLSGLPYEWLEENWTLPKVAEVREAYREMAKRFTLSKGYRPTPERLTQWCELADEPPEVIFLDYLSLLDRDKFAGPEVQRVSRLVEDLQVWKSENGVILFVVHQVGRFDEGASRYHGDTPMWADLLKYAGEEVADLVLGTYRPALNHLGNMTRDQAQAESSFDEERWEEAVARVRRYQDSTFLQLLKNRPGTRVDLQGIELRSKWGEALKMVPISESVGEDMKEATSRV